MKKGKRHTPEQIIRKLREADAMLAAGREVEHVCQALEVSEATFHRWRNQYGGMKAEEAKRLKGQLQASAGHFFRRNMTNCKRSRATSADQIIP